MGRGTGCAVAFLGLFGGLLALLAVLLLFRII